MTKVRRRKGLSGTVLIMILTVMVVLMIMLMATLSVVTAANQRIYTKFEENQAYYTARSALDVFADNLFADASYVVDGRTYLNGSGTNSPMKQGLGLQLDMYKITAYDPEKAAADPSNPEAGYSENILQDKLKALPVANASSGTKKEYSLYFGTTYQSPANKGVMSMEYDVYLPRISNSQAGTGDYGKFSDITMDTNGDGKIDATDMAHATIKLEVLERKYNLGTYMDSGVEKTIDDADRADFFKNKADKVAEAITNGSRKKDTMRVKITATASFEGYESTAVLICDTNEPPRNNSSRAITAFGAMKGTNHAYIVGGVSMVGTPGAMAPMRNGGGVFGTVYDEMGLDFNVASPIYLTEQEYVFVAGDFKGENNVNIKGAVPLASAGDKDKRPFIFVGGTLYPNNGFTGVGGTASTEAVDIITLGGINWTSNSFGINGDIYSKGDCTFNSTAGTPNINGDIYIDGDLTVGGNVANLDGSGNFTGIKFGASCNVYVRGSIIYNGAYYSPTAITNADGGSVNVLLSSFTLPAITDITDTSTGDADVKFKLPKSGVANGVTKILETHKTNYDEYYYVDEATGKYTDAAGTILTGSPIVPVKRSAQNLAGNVDFTNASTHPTDTLDALASGNMTIDTTTDPTRYVLHGGLNFNGKTLKISGGGTVEIYLMPYTSPWYSETDYSSGNGDLDIIVADDTTLKIYGGVSGINYSFDKVRILTETVQKALPPAYGGTNAELNVGSESGFGIKVPKIYYYFDGGQININNGTNFFTGYMFAPTSKLVSNAGSSIKFSNLKYNGASVDPNWVYTILGSLLCDDFEFQNDHGVVYINPSLADDGDPGEPIHSFDYILYTRN